ncbi:MAG TPA: hypothetical protein PLX20_13195 [Rhodocyclaceae bacterium]|nr:hypothetical protein [Rhodocyclaceae bacterium]HMV52520.1 hypothetical protein [Rhodocyclaceae bacterium]HMZ84303.1 hypothetical protein [Rhodocyclaceae bacterium]HNA03302.1 hypothetical protein [Rhodocyclaceae bacterium]HNB78769.1 hypothetical protein [Rhodocyclaceae bacterium]
MVVLRILAVVAVIAIGGCILLHLFTGDRRYLILAWRLFRYAAVVALILFGLLIAERLMGGAIPFV